MKHGILCVDDESDNVDALERLFRKDYQVFKATSASEGLALLDQNRNIALIISDQRMPNMTGVEFLTQSMKTHPDAIRILLTGYTDIESVIGAINSGQVYRYINKPWDSLDLKNTVDKAIEKFDISGELKEKNIALKNALAELQTLDQAKTQFMVLINHELKTPLTIIISFLALLKESRIDDEQGKYVKRIDGAVNQLQKLIDDTLELLNAEAGAESVKIGKVSLGELSMAIDGIVDNLGIPKSRFEKEGLDSGKFLWSNADILSKIFTRLLENAKKFSTKGTPIRLRVLKSSNDLIQFSLSNEGAEIPKNIISKITKPFVLNEDILNHSKGTGLGLSIAQGWLRRLNSNLQIVSEDGEVIVRFSISATK